MRKDSVEVSVMHDSDDDVEHVLEAHDKSRKDFAYDIFRALSMFRALDMSFAYTKLICGTIGEMDDEIEREFSRQGEH